MSMNIAALNTGFPTENRYDPPSGDAHDTKIHDTKDGYKPVDPGTQTDYIAEADPAWKYRTSLGATDTITDINDIHQFALERQRYLFIGNEVGTNGIANAQVMQENYQKQGAASVFFMVA